MDKIAIIGTGLIGTSIGLAIKKIGIKNVIIVGSDLESRRANKAKKMGAVDKVEKSLVEAVSGASLVFITTPITAIKDVMEIIGPRLEEGAIVTDTGGTKKNVLAWADTYLPKYVDFIGGHPLAGKETAGPDHADVSMFKDRPYCIVPRSGSSNEGVKTVVDLATGIGSKPYFINAEEHDSFVAAVSHLPFILSTTLIGATSKSPQWGDISHLASSGFRDVSRLASGDSIMHRDVCITNKEGIIYWINEIIVELERVKDTIRNDDVGDQLYDLFEKAFEEREKWLGGVTTPWARAEYERPRTPSFSHVTTELMFGSRAARGIFGDDEKTDKGKLRGDI